MVADEALTRAAGDGGDGVDEQRAVDLREVALLVEVAGLSADADERAHGVEEVAQHEAEDPEDRGRDAELGERAEVERADEAEVGHGDDVCSG